MCTALSDGKFLYDRTANGTGFAVTAIHSKMILKLTAAIDPVDAGAVAADTFPKNGADRFVQRGGLFPRNGIRHCQRVQSGDMQTFVCINISEPGDEGLVEQ